MQLCRAGSHPTQHWQEEVAMGTRSAFVMGFCFLIITHCRANYTITGCSSDNYIDVREDTGTRITCEGIGEDHNIYWALSDTRIGNCFVKCSLSDPGNTDYELMRISRARSELKIQGNYRQKAGQTITCSRLMNQTAASCQINIIHPGFPTLPFLTVDKATRTVNGSYRVVKMYSSRNNYGCVWIMENETHLEIKRERATPDLSRFNESEKEFYNGTCSFSWPLPTEGGRYSINLTVVPGETDKSYSAGTFVIEATQATETGPAVPGAAIGGGVGAVIAVIIVAVIVLVIVWRRRRNTTTRKTHDGAAAGEGIMNPKFDAGYSSVADDLANPQVSEATTQQDTTTDQPTANAKPAGKGKPNARPPRDQQDTFGAQSEAPTGAEERIHNRNTGSAKQNYENVGASLTHTPFQTQRDIAEAAAGDEYNTLNLLNPQGQRREEPNPDYSHLGSL